MKKLEGLEKGVGVETPKLPTDDDYKVMARASHKILKPIYNDITKIDGVIACGIGLARQDFRKVLITIMYSNKIDANQVVEITDKITALGLDEENCEIRREPKPRRKDRTASFSGERIKHER